MAHETNNQEQTANKLYREYIDTGGKKTFKEWIEAEKAKPGGGVLGGLLSFASSLFGKPDQAATPDTSNDDQDTRILNLKPWVFWSAVGLVAGLATFGIYKLVKKTKNAKA